MADEVIVAIRQKLADEEQSRLMKSIDARLGATMQHLGIEEPPPPDDDPHAVAHAAAVDAAGASTRAAMDQVAGSPPGPAALAIPPAPSIPPIPPAPAEGIAGGIAKGWE